MLLRIFLNLPNQQKVCSAIIKLASGQSSLTFSGAYKVLHSGRWEIKNLTMKIAYFEIIFFLTLWFFIWRGSIHFPMVSHTSENFPTRGRASLRNLRRSILHLRYKGIISELETIYTMMYILSYDRYILLQSSGLTSFKTSHKNAINIMATWKWKQKLMYVTAQLNFDLSWEWLRNQLVHITPT